VKQGYGSASGLFKLAAPLIVGVVIFFWVVSANGDALAHTHQSAQLSNSLQLGSSTPTPTPARTYPTVSSATTYARLTALPPTPVLTPTVALVRSFRMRRCPTGRTNGWGWRPAPTRP